MFLLVLMLDNPNLMDSILEAWADVGIRGAHALESAACRIPSEGTPARGPTGFLSFAHLLPAGRTCTALLLAPVDSLATAERAAEQVTRIAGPWSQGGTIAMLALPISATWGNVFPTAIAPGIAENETDLPPREPGLPVDAP